MIEGHLRRVIRSCVDSSLESTRTYWRERLGFPPEIVNDPRPIADALRGLGSCLTTKSTNA